MKYLLSVVIFLILAAGGFFILPAGRQVWQDLKTKRAEVNQEITDLPSESEEKVPAPPPAPNPPAPATRPVPALPFPVEVKAVLSEEVNDAECERKIRSHNRKVYPLFEGK